MLKKTNQYYKYSKLYEVIKIGNNEKVILKRKSETDPFIYKLAVEDFYDKLVEVHVNTGHG